MNTNENPEQEQSKQTKFLSPWLAYPLALIVWWVLLGRFHCLLRTMDGWRAVQAFGICWA
jgi:hypothetical protein